VPHRMVPRIPARLCGALVLLALALASCRGREPEPAPAPTPSPSPTPVPTVEHPLTGAVERRGQEWEQRQALAVKIGNSAPERPQAGLEDADVVYEELAEGGITRFIAVFHSREPGQVGPVRSARFVDPDVLAPFSPLFAYAGGVPPVVARVSEVDSITDVNFDRFPEAYERIGGRRAPYNLYTSSDALWRRGDGSPPPALFSWLPEEEGTDPASGEPGTSVTMSFSPMTSVRYQYDTDTETYLRFNGSTPHTLEDGSQVAPTNVVIQLVNVRPGTVVDQNRQTSPDSQVIGDGDAIVLRGGRAYRGRWSRGGGEHTRFADAEGNPLLLARGTTYVALVPAGRTVSVS